MRDLINDRFVEAFRHLCEVGDIKTNKEFAELMSVTSSRISEILKKRMRAGIEMHQFLFENYGVRYDYIFKGELPILDREEVISSMSLDKKTKENNYDIISKENANTGSEDKLVCCMSTEYKIPLVSIAAVADFGSGEFIIEERGIRAYYVVPKFNDQKIDFMIEITGSSMYPKYNSGDVVACKIIKKSAFLQWNKVHVVATQEQGVLIKRLKQGIDDNCFLVISDNEDCDPFEISKNEITWLALVVGVIRLE